MQRTASVILADSCQEGRNNVDSFTVSPLGIQRCGLEVASLPTRLTASPCLA